MKTIEEPNVLESIKTDDFQHLQRAKNGVALNPNFTNCGLPTKELFPCSKKIFYRSNMPDFCSDCGKRICPKCKESRL